jgi:hypothetical protein
MERIELHDRADVTAFASVEPCITRGICFRARRTVGVTTLTLVVVTVFLFCTGAANGFRTKSTPGALLLRLRDLLLLLFLSWACSFRADII